MTVHFAYSLSPTRCCPHPFPANAADVDFASIGQMDFSHGYFLGDVAFRVGELDLGAQDVPVLDFAIHVDALVRGLGEADGAEETFEHTESRDTITFRRLGDSVEIESNHAAGTAMLGYVELRAATNRSVLTVVRGLTERRWQGRSLVRPHPGLDSNPFVVKALSAAMWRSAEQPGLTPSQLEAGLSSPDHTVRKSLVDEVAGRIDPESRCVQWRLLRDEDRAVIEAMAETLLVMADVDSVALVCRALRVWGETDDEGVWQTIAWCIKAPLDFQLFDVAGALREVALGEPGEDREGALDALDWLGLSAGV